MMDSKKQCLIVATSVLIVSTIETVILYFLRCGVLQSGWFLALYFPISLGFVVFTATSYLIMPAIKSRRMLRAIGIGAGLTLLWFAVFMFFVMAITKWGGTLLTVEPE
jgi:hypothetical protein